MKSFVSTFSFHLLSVISLLRVTCSFLVDLLFVVNCLLDMLFSQQINFVIVECLVQC